MTLTVLSVPQICVSPPPPTQLFVEPFSPFTGCRSGSTVDEEEDGLRSALLSPPIPLKHLSPLCPTDVPVKGQGLERERFEMLLKASRERTMVLGKKKSLDLRKEVAVKTHRSKQVERRARFLLKVQQPPSPTAANMPKTPPESPSMFHFSLPSPGLISPLEMYEHLENECVTSNPWIEQVDFRLPPGALLPQAKSIGDKSSVTWPSRPSAGKPLPSLDQISAHLTTKQMSSAHEVPRRLPSFLHQEPQSGQPRRRASPPPITVGRLQLPGPRLRSPSPPLPEAGSVYAAPPSPKTPELVITTTLVPRTTPSTRNLTEANVEAFSRANMLKTLRRRSHPGHQLMEGERDSMDERSRRRLSAPSELAIRERAEFKHPVLNLRGAF